jgi:translation elongation factor EF-1beta
LREIIPLDEEIWAKTLKTAIKEGLTAEDVQEATKGQAPKKKSKDRARRSAEQIAFGGIKRFTRAAINTSDKEELNHMLDEVADEVIVQGMDDELLPLLKELTKLIEARSKRR